MLATTVIALGGSALTSEAAVPTRTGAARLCVITCGPNDHPGCTLCRGECSDENNTVGCYPDYLATPLNRARGADRPMEARVTLWLVGVAGLVLLIACANIGNMHIVRGLERRPELAVRLALGGTRWHLAASVLGEALLLSAAAGVVAILVAAWTGRTLVARILGGVPQSIAAVNGRLLVTMLVLTGGVAIVTAMLPILQLRDGRLQSVLRAASPTRGRAGNAGRFALLAFQVAVTSILLSGAGLFLKSFRAVSRIDTGFDPDRVVVVDLDSQIAPSTSALEQQYMLIQRALGTNPDVARTALGVSAPFLSGVAVRVEVPGRDSLPPETGGAIHVNAVTPDFFSVLGLRLTAGRAFEPHDAGNGDVTVVSRHFAETIWPGEQPIGKCIYIYSRKSACRVVVGVIADPKRDKIGEEPVSQFFVPLEGAPALATNRLLFAQVRGSADEAAIGITRVVQRTLPHAPHPKVQPLSTLIARQQRPWSLGATLFSTFGALAVVIASLGLYNVVFHDVRARERELAIRVTLGAGARDIAQSVIARTGGAAVIGLIAGLVAGTWMGLYLQPLLFQTSGIDLTIDVGIIIMTMVIVLVASMGPLHRAVRLQPAIILREQ
jgi:predicted permease